MKKIISLFTLILMVGSLSFAAPIEGADELFEQVNGKELPRFLSILFGNERINAEVQDGEDVIYLHAVTEKGVVSDIGEGQIDDATLVLYTDRETIEKIATSEDPRSEFDAALSDKRVRYEASGFGKVKYGVSFFLAKLFL